MQLTFQEWMAANLFWIMLYTIIICGMLVFLLRVLLQVKIAWGELFPVRHPVHAKMEEEVPPLPDRGDRYYYQQSHPKGGEHG